MTTILIISNVVLWVIVLALGFLLWGNLRITGLLDWRVIQLEATTPSRIGRSGLKPGKKAPDFTLPGTGGGEVSLHDFTGRRVLLVFVQTHCGPCHEMVPELNRLVGRERDLQIVVVSRADPEEARQWVRDVDARFPVVVQRDWSVSKRYQVFATPFAFLIDRDGVIEAKGIISSREHIDYVLTSADRPSQYDQPDETRPSTEDTGEAAGADPETSVSHPSREVHHVT